MTTGNGERPSYAPIDAKKAKMEVRNSFQTKEEQALLEDALKKDGKAVSKMTLNLRWAETHAKHPLASKILDLQKKYGNVLQDESSAKQALEAFQKIQASLGIDSDGIVGAGTLNAYMQKERDKERQEAEKMITTVGENWDVAKLEHNTHYGAGSETQENGRIVTDAQGREYRIYKQEDGSLIYERDGKKYAKDGTGKLQEQGADTASEENHTRITEALKAGQGTKYQEIDGRYFEVKRDEAGNLTAFRGTSGAAEYYNVDTKKWEEDSDTVKAQRQTTGAQKGLGDAILRGTRPTGPDGNQDYLSWGMKGETGTTYGDVSLGDLDSAISANNWSNHEGARQILRVVKQNFDQLSQEDREKLKGVALKDYRRMIEDPVFAVQTLATDKATRLPRGLGEDGVQYQNFNGNIFVSREGEKVPKILLTNGKFGNIRDLFSKPGAYDLPDGKELRVTLDQYGKKVFRIAKDTKSDPEWVLNENGELKEIKET